MTLPVEPYTDPFLQSNFTEYFAPLQKVGSTPHAPVVSTSFGTRGHLLRKQKNSKITVILDARRTNERFCQPLGVALSTAETLSRIEGRLPDGVKARSTEAMRFFGEGLGWVVSNQCVLVTSP